MCRRPVHGSGKIFLEYIGYDIFILLISTGTLKIIIE